MTKFANAIRNKISGSTQEAKVVPLPTLEQWRKGYEKATRRSRFKRTLGDLGASVQRWFAKAGCFGPPAVLDNGPLVVLPPASFDWETMAKRIVDGPAELVSLEVTEDEPSVLTPVSDPTPIDEPSIHTPVSDPTPIDDPTPPDSPAPIDDPTPTDMTPPRVRPSPLPACSGPKPRRGSKHAPQYTRASGKNAWAKSLRDYPTPTATSRRTGGSPRAVDNLPGSPQAEMGLIKARTAFKLV